MEGVSMKMDAAPNVQQQHTSSKGSASTASHDLERTLIGKIGAHKEKIFVLFEQMQKQQRTANGSVVDAPALYEQLIEELELVAPLFDLLEHKGLSIYITSLVDTYGARFPQMLTKICKRFGVKRPASLPRLPDADTQLSAKKLERKRAKERLAALFSPAPMPTTPYLDKKEKQEKEQEERAKELAKTPLSALLAKEQQSKQHRRRSTVGTMRFSEGVGHLHKQVLLTSPARRAPSTPTRSGLVINRPHNTPTAATSTSTTPSTAELTPSRKRKPDDEEDGDQRTRLTDAPHTPEPATSSTTPTEPSTEPPQKRRKTGGFAITRANPVTPSSPAATLPSSTPTEPQTEPRLRTSGFAITRAPTPMSPLAVASPRAKRFGGARTPARAGSAAGALPRLTVRATRQLFAGEAATSSSLSPTPAAPADTVICNKPIASLFDAIAIPPAPLPSSPSPSSSFMNEC